METITVKTQNSKHFNCHHLVTLFFPLLLLFLFESYKKIHSLECPAFLASSCKWFDPQQRINFTFISMSTVKILGQTTLTSQTQKWLGMVHCDGRLRFRIKIFEKKRKKHFDPRACDLYTFWPLHRFEKARTKGKTNTIPCSEIFIRKRQSNDTLCWRSENCYYHFFGSLSIFMWVSDGFEINIVTCIWITHNQTLYKTYSSGQKQIRAVKSSVCVVGNRKSVDIDRYKLQIIFELQPNGQWWDFKTIIFLDHSGMYIKFMLSKYIQIIIAHKTIEFLYRLKRVCARITHIPNRKWG